MDTATPMGSMVFTVMAALSPTERETTRERITDSVAKRRAAGHDLGGRRQLFTDSQLHHSLRLIEAEGHPGRPGSGMSRATLYRRMREFPPVAV
ncbi:MAG: recombinase family protein [Actinomycetota bacterium]